MTTENFNINFQVTDCGDKMPSWVPRNVRYVTKIFTLSFSFSDKHYNYIFQKGNRLLQNIQNKTSTNIVYTRNNDIGTFIVEGYSIEQANLALSQLLIKVQNAVVYNVEYETEQIEVSTKHCGLIIGKGGSLCRDIKNYYKLKNFIVEPHPDESESKKGISILKIVGPKEDMSTIVSNLKLQFKKVFEVPRYDLTPIKFFLDDLDNNESYKKSKYLIRISCYYCKPKYCSEDTESMFKKVNGLKEFQILDQNGNKFTNLTEYVKFYSTMQGFIDNTVWSYVEFLVDKKWVFGHTFRNLSNK